MSSKKNIRDEILERARAWHVRLSNEQSSQEDWMEFTDWLEADPAHVAAYDAVELAIADVLASPAPVAAKTQRAANDTSERPEPSELSDNVVPLSRVRHQAPRKAAVWMGRIVAIAAVLVAALVVINRTDIFSPEAQAVQYATNIGEQRNVVLADGTQIVLNTNTRLSVKMDKASRKVNLESGEAFFTIAKDERPFTIQAMGTQITDIGTAFDVYVADKALTVSVAEGIVEVDTGAQTVRLTKGMTAVRSRDDDKVRVATVDTDTISTWRDGVLVFEDQPLAALIPELNRYFKTPIELGSKDIAGLTFSGVLNIRDEEKMLSSLSALLPVQAEKQNGKIVLQRQN